MNFWIGCQEVSPACDHCYARVQNEHWKWVAGWGPDGERRRTSRNNWNKLRKWNREAEASGVRARVFSNSLSDFFDNRAPPVWRREAWHYIEQSPALDFLLLTKRSQNIPRMLPDPETGVKPWGEGWSNVWLGTTVENQEEADRRIPQLLAVPAAVHFLSCEPLLGPLDLSNFTDPDDQACFADDLPAMKKWVITGGESGPHARDTDPSWFRDIGLQCAAAGVPWFHKQMTRKARIPHDLFVREFPCPDGAVVYPPARRGQRRKR